MRLPVVACFAGCVLFAAVSARAATGKDTPRGLPATASRDDNCQHTIRVAVPAPEDSVYTKYTLRFYRQLEQETGRRLCIHLRAGSLFREAELIDMVKNSVLDTAAVSAAALEHHVPELMVFSLPFLFETEDEMDFMAERYRQYFMKLGEEKGFYLSLYPLGFMPIFATSETTLDLDAELAVRKVWVYQGSEFMKAGFHAIGAKRLVSLDLADVAPALRSGTVEVVFGTPVLVVVLGWYPYVRQVVMSEWVAAFAVSLSNLAFTRKVPDDVRFMVEEAEREIKQGITRLWRRDDEIALVGLMKRGVKIVHPPHEEVEKVRARLKSFWEYGVGRWYPRELLDGIIHDLEEYRAAKARPAVEPKP